jgi:alkylation response protein AidB-like acyl-CoA dehydrogenase
VWFRRRGICTHAFYEALDHAARRNLYGKFVTDFPHIQQLFTDAYTRLVDQLGGLPADAAEAAPEAR